MNEYNWPGNIRELEHLLERAAIMSPTAEVSLTEPLVVNPLAAVPPMTQSNPGVKLFDQAEKDNIMEALRVSNFRIRGKGGAAELLDMKPTTLESRIAKLGIQRSR